MKDGCEFEQVGRLEQGGEGEGEGGERGHDQGAGGLLLANVCGGGAKGHRQNRRV